jgi:hypothetical protein
VGRHLIPWSVVALASLCWNNGPNKHACYIWDLRLTYLGFGLSPCFHICLENVHIIYFNFHEVRFFSLNKTKQNTSLNF